MAKPSSRLQLKEYCLRKLGKPVIEVNVDDDQIEDLIDDTIQIFNERAYNGMERMYLKYKLTQEDIDNGKIRNFTTTKTDTNDSDLSRTLNFEDDDYVILRPLTYFASKKYGANTKWCTTQENGEYFNKYNKKGVLIYCIGKTNGNKVACFNSLDKNDAEFSLVLHGSYLEKLNPEVPNLFDGLTPSNDNTLQVYAQ